MIHIFEVSSQGLTKDTWNLKYPALSEISTMVPSYEEQTEIASYFAILDHLITLHQRKPKARNNIKKPTTNRYFRHMLRRTETVLKIVYGKMEGIIRRPSMYFDNTYDPEWLNDELVRSMILDVDKSEVKGPRLIDSPVLGPISPKDLSGGVKALILMLKDESGKVLYASACGDNCAKWILEIAKRKKLTINLRHIMDFGDGPFEIYFENNKRLVKDGKAYLDAIFDIEENGYEG